MNRTNTFEEVDASNVICKCVIRPKSSWPKNLETDEWSDAGDFRLAGLIKIIEKYTFNQN